MIHQQVTTMPIRYQDKGKSNIVEIKEAINKSHKILVTSHIRPDGDAVGSLIALGLALKTAGKDVDMFLEDGVPANFAHLEGSDQVFSFTADKYDLVIVLDCSDYDRVGSTVNQKFYADINIDHHITNLCYARINYVDNLASATAEILANLIPEIGLEIDQQIANALLNGIVTDTIGFRTNNVSPKTLNIAADLVKSGADLGKIYYKGVSERTFVGAQYWGYGLIKLRQQNGVIWTSLNLNEREQVGYQGNDDADLINILSSIENAKIAIIFIEQYQGRVKISWRLCGPEQSDLDVSQLALEFGGGGHKSAAGAIVSGSLEDVQAMVLDRTHSILWV